MPRHSRPEIPPRWKAWLQAFDLTLEVAGRSDRTRNMYADAIGWCFARLPDDVNDWSQVTHHHLRDFFAELRRASYSQSYINNIGRCVQAYDKWHSIEEDVPRVFGLKLPVPAAPKLGTNPPTVLELGQLATLIAHAEKGRTFEDRRDAAILRLFGCTGCRLAEVAGLQVADVNLGAREAVVTGKGSKVRVVRFDAKCAQAVQRYLRVRAAHKHAYLPALWLGIRRRTGMTDDGIYQAVQRRGRKAEVTVHPHLFRHTFAHRWLDAGGSEGDLMELMGWDSPQMLRHYGASARGARARRAYDRINPMGDV